MDAVRRWEGFRPGLPGFFHGTYLGVFDIQKGTYELDIEVLQDSSCLNPGHPKVIVRARKDEYAGDISLLLWLSALTVAAGTSLMLLPRIEYRGKNRRARCVSRTLMPSASISSGRRKLPLKRKFSGMPSCGLVAVRVYFVVVIPV
jgi:hypothetical protein